jgi:hypothetical protein
VDSRELTAILRDLAAIDAEGKLEELATQHALECRERELPPDEELLDADADFAARRLARFVNRMTGDSVIECERAGREILRRRPRLELLRELIDFYLDRDQRDNAAKLDREWRRRR